MNTADRAQARRRRVRPSVAAALIGIACLAIFALANVHLVYVAVTSQPDCITHVKPGESRAARDFSAAGSAC